MQVQNDMKIPSFTQQEKPLELKAGDVYQATIKDKISDHEAVLQIRGQEVKVSIQGNFPSSGNLSIEVKDTKQAMPVVKALPQTEAAVNQQKTVPFVMGNTKLPDDLKAAVNLLVKHNIPLEQTTLSQVKSFMEHETGTTTQKLETIAAIINKGLDLTKSQLQAVHQALHSSSIEQLVQDIAPGFDQKTMEAIKGNTTVILSKNRNITQSDQLYRVGMDKVNEVLEKLAQGIKDPQKLRLIDSLQKELIKEGGLERVIKLLHANFSSELKADPALSSLVKDAIKLGSLSQSFLFEAVEKSNVQTNQANTIQQAIKMVQKSPNMNELMQFIKEQLIDSTNLSTIESESLRNVVEHAEQLQSSGRELAARGELMTELDAINKNHKLPVTAPSSDDIAYEVNDDFLATLPIQSKDIIVTTITKKLSQAAIDFKETKREISTNLQSIIKLFDTFKQNAGNQAKPLLESTIKQLDKAILRSDFMLYTDMTTEKKLLQASSQLNEAKKLLSTGNFSDANKIVSEVKTMMDKLIFKPSNVKVQHFVTKEFLQQEEPSLSKQLVHSLNESNQTLKQSPSARQAFEFVRNLGLTYESEQAHSLITKGQGQASLDSTVKGILQRLAQTEGNPTVDQALQNLTGQQLLSRSDQSSTQSLMFALPFLIQNKVENVKVYINSKNQSEKIDWEHCSLYFLFETKKLGEVGILLSSSDRTLNLTIKNDRQGFKEKITPLAEVAKERLKEIGYNIGTIQFTRLTESNKSLTPKVDSEKKNITRGLDFTI
ncbi:hypothetical protein B4102_2692 [Heyndrickxia sporothermodurans]|uniref:Flagellar hook-length control protein-like C-terminal domain-containing protein n=1 Tax=Heyndrickxia sporothermodurans TaxID=46224 RepID=A0A150LA84_9BACI|nr:hypothetical protein [Heyndrickxia sporothermodurans]KYD09165.1 hypothetical protein B4102_2692 [Heyndrickxia sporothermodurans]